MIRASAFLCLLSTIFSPQVVRSQEASAEAGDTAAVDNDLAVRAVRIIARNCGRCHKGTGSSFFDARQVASMIDAGYVTEGDHESSHLFERMFDGSMPPKNRPQLPRPSGSDLETVKEWLNAGAHAPEFQARPSLGLDVELKAIHRFLAERDQDDVAFFRFFSLRTLNNQPTIEDEQLSLTRIALAKALNSLSWEPHIAPLTPIATLDGTDKGEGALLYAVDLRELGWTREHWNLILQKYPYAVGYEAHENEVLDQVDRKISNLRGSGEPCVVRADWFISVATKPPTYHGLLFDLHLPTLRARAATQSVSNPKSMTALDLESFLGLDVEENIRRGIAKRTGYTESGVSGQNRMFEHHPLPRGGAYWKSYDFLDSNRTALLAEFPFGPKFDRNPFPELAFDHDGGEIIFNLPNGLQAYLLVDGKGNRIDAGPIEVVADSLKTSGNEQIVTGVSCMACHREGMIESPVDEVREFASLAGEPRQFLRQLYPEAAVMDKLIGKSKDVFLKSQEAAVESVVGDLEVEQLQEPIGEVARTHLLEPMSIETVAAELDVTVQKLQLAIANNDRLQALGLRVLLREGGSVKRAAWESPSQFPMFKEAAREFGFSPNN